MFLARSHLIHGLGLHTPLLASLTFIATDKHPGLLHNPHSSSLSRSHMAFAHSLNGAWEGEKKNSIVDLE